MGLISSFLGGAGNAMADAGKMMFADKLRGEREEANFLRDQELGKNKTDADQAFRSSESEKDRAHKTSEGKARDDAALERTQYSADTKAKSAGGGDKPTNQMKNVDFLMSKKGGGKTVSEAITIAFPSSKIKHTDQEGNQIVVVPAAGGGFEEVGKIVTDKKGKPRWLPKGEKMDEPITGKDLKAKAAAMSKEEGTDDDWIPFNERGRKDPEVRAALEKERSSKKTGGLVGGAMGGIKPTVKPQTEKKAAPQKAVDAVMADPKLIPQFVEHYGYDPTKQ
jgi:hypothetical protein